MRFDARSGLLVLALALVACGTSPGRLPGTRQAAPAAPAPDVQAPQYHLDAMSMDGMNHGPMPPMGSKGTMHDDHPMHEMELKVKSATASSQRDDGHFKPFFAVDDNFKTFWAPRKNDPNPTLTLATVHRDEIMSLAIAAFAHLGHATFDVAISSGGGDFIPAATGVPLDGHFLQHVKLHPAAGNQVQLTFHTTSPSRLNVAEVDLFGMENVMTPPVPKPLAPNTIYVRDYEFVPNHLTVRAGTTVTWRFLGPSLHTTNSDDGDTQTWGSGPKMPGQTFTVTFPKTGHFPFHCEIHDFMQGSVDVN